MFAWLSDFYLFENHCGIQSNGLSLQDFLSHLFKLIRANAINNLEFQTDLNYNLDKEEVLIRKTAYAIQVIHVYWPYVSGQKRCLLTGIYVVFLKQTSRYLGHYMKHIWGMEVGEYETDNCWVPTTC